MVTELQLIFSLKLPYPFNDIVVGTVKSGNSWRTNKKPFIDKHIIKLQMIVRECTISVVITHVSHFAREHLHMQVH